MSKFNGNPIFYGTVTVAVLIALIFASILVNPMPAQIASAAAPAQTFSLFGPITSDQSAVKPTKTPAPLSSFFTDNFSNPNTLANNWQIVDASPNWGGPSSWIVKNKQMQQNSGIFFNGKNRFQVLEGTNLVSKAVEPIEFSYKVTFYTSMGKGGIGILFHYKDEQHYYRFVTVQNSSDGGPFRQLQAMVQGNFVVLAQNNQGYDPAKPHTVIITIKNDNISVAFDGKKQFTAPDGHDNANGHVGLQTYANHAAFTNLSVARP
ncbi:MAG: hypothetical protein P4L50_28335 [Anaerolineaceae bacterium]|nr:hypothetical protein [Anaerolineaceae bacterium]